MRKICQTIIRGIASIVLLFFVWTNSHWSIALSLTLVFISFEMMNSAIRMFIKELKPFLDRVEKELK